MTSDLQQTRYDKLVRRVGGIIGPGSKVSEALPELFPTLDVENVPGELLLLMGTRLGFGGGAVPAVILQFGRGQLFNPADSGVIVTITTIIAASPSTAVLRWGREDIAYPLGLGTESLRDFREPVTNRPVAQIRQQSTVALANATGQTQVFTSRPFRLFDPNGIAILAPGQGFEIGSSNDDLLFFYTYYWREREALQSELNLPG